MEVRPFQEWVDPEYLSEVKATVDRENEGLPEKAPAEIERQLLAKINAYYHDAFTLTQEHVRDRWHFEQAIRRPYFHVTKLDDAELTNWHKYLDFEEKQRDYERIVFLYERCLVACALYPKFWIRYARWMFSQGKEENARIIYVRACTQFVPTHGINIRLKWARFEEKLGRINVARDIHHAILNEIVDHPKTILSLSGLIRRHEGVDMAVQTLDGYILRGAKNAGILVGEQARMLYYCKNTLEDARRAFIDKKDLLIACADFWLAWLKFEIDQPARFDHEVRETDSKEVHSRVKAVYEQIPKFNFSPTVWKHMTSTYKRFLMSRGGPDVAEEYVLLDMWGAGYMQADVEESVTVSA
ncbi:hypothetical protein B5807_01651 [Epicoccum nigrum]|jgi:pre-mRNA-processing factor 39|uniref:Suppressor of forked domain-containing protein n=1 Tax=Epicoccum nigrum TaxID=105696 RepID=A0A1Y2MEQ1_EPING|nr:hypothetical protein B5807_01651 [Epicoccum nigrum]